MPRPPSSEVRALLTLYAQARRGEYNLGAFLRERPELIARLGLVDVERDDADLALQLAPIVGKYKKRLALEQAAARGARSERAARTLAATARHRLETVELDPAVLLGDLLADSGKKYVGFELTGVRVLLLRQLLLRARAALRGFARLAASVDEHGLHITWREGRGGLNFRPQLGGRGDPVLLIDLRPVARATPPSSRVGPILLAEVLTNLGLY